MSNFLYDPYAILCKVYGEGAYVKQAVSSTPVDPKNKPLTVKCVYGVLENDILLDYWLKNLAEKSPKPAIKIVLKLSMYLIKFTSKPVYTVTNEAVDLVKKLGKGGTGGFINAVLRSFAAKEIALPNGGLERLSVEYSYPLFALKMLDKEYGRAAAEDIIKYRGGGVTLRIVKNTDGYLNDFKLSPTPFKGLYTAKNFVMQEGFERGEYTFQSIGSVAICDIVEPCESLLDACAAPGGKSVLLADKCKYVTACDIHAHRVELINSYAKRMEAGNVKAVLCDSSELNKEYVEMFDGVLVDAPCSGLGVVHENPDIKLNRKSGDIFALNEIQLKILKNCANYVKIGGFLYYSTCSVLKSENSDICQKFLNEDKRYDCVTAGSPLKHIKKEYGLQFLPHISMGAGFFIAKFKRVE